MGPYITLKEATNPRVKLIKEKKLNQYVTDTNNKVLKTWNIGLPRPKC